MERVSEENKIVKNFKINFKLLESIMYCQAPTGTDYELVKEKFLVSLINSLTKDMDITLENKDRNIYITKGVAANYPTVVAHYDTAQDYHEGLTILKTGEWMHGFDTARAEQCGIGADDSVGVYFALEMLLRLPACKVALFYGEERGCLGSASCDMSFFDNSSIVTQLDRRSYSNDFIKYTNGVQTFSEEHYDLIEPLLDKYGYSFNNGSCTDVGKLRQRGLQVSSHNLSCGYFNEHTDNEVIHIPSMNNALSLAQELLELVYSKSLVLTFPKQVVAENKSWSFDDADYRSYNSSYNASYESIWGVDEAEKQEAEALGYEYNEEWGIFTKNGKISSLHMRDFYPLLDESEVREEYRVPKMSKEDAKGEVEYGSLEPVAYASIYKDHYVKCKDFTCVEDCLKGECPACLSRVSALQYLPEYNVTECLSCGSAFYVDFDMVDVENLPEDSRGTFNIDNY